MHAVSITARMPAAASKTDRRNNRGAPFLKVSSKVGVSETVDLGGRLHANVRD
jgi:hypothetical protein